ETRDHAFDAGAGLLVLFDQLAALAQQVGLPFAQGLVFLMHARAEGDQAIDLLFDFVQLFQAHGHDPVLLRVTILWRLRTVNDLTRILEHRARFKAGWQFLMAQLPLWNARRRGVRMPGVQPIRSTSGYQL